MNWKERVCQPGVSAALGAALLFGAGTPFAKLLLNSKALGYWRACSTLVLALALLSISA